MAGPFQYIPTKHPQSPSKCYYCGSVGIHKSECPEYVQIDRQPYEDDSKPCYYCGKIETHLNECPEKRVVLDTSDKSVDHRLIELKFDSGQTTAFSWYLGGPLIYYSIEQI